MSSKERYDAYAAELASRFEELTRWAIEHWPRDDFPLMESDFEAARREISEVLGPKLGDPGQDESAERPADRVPDPPGMKRDGKGEFRDMNPMPWP